MSDELPAQQAINDLNAQVTSPEDQAVVDQWQAEHNKERAEAVATIGNTALPKMAPDGTLLTPSEAAQLNDDKDKSAGTAYSNGRRA